MNNRNRNRHAKIKEKILRVSLLDKGLLAEENASLGDKPLIT